ncbi:aminopeptidase, partial [Massilia atriviolacea]
MTIRHLSLALAACLACTTAAAAPAFDDKFRQLEELLPTSGITRTASGAPGHAYWQQRADYKLRATLDEAKRRIDGSGSVTYHNNSPDTLSYLWVQLDQNMFRADSDNRAISTVPSREAWARGTEADGMRFEAMRFIVESRTFEGGFNITALTDGGGQPLKYTINKTMMRIDLP